MTKGQVLEFNHDKAIVPTSSRSIDDSPNIVYIVGESLTLSNMGIYGYEKDTTPKIMIDLIILNCSTHKESAIHGSSTNA